MKLKLPRYRRWLLIACLAAVAIAVVSWQLSTPRGRFTREQYDRIRLGMTPAEVASVMGGVPPPDTPENYYGFWECLAEESDGLPSEESDLRVYAWTEESVAIWVACRDGKTIQKEIHARVPSWKIKAYEWLHTLRGLVGW
jgi:hypothetical protein